MFSGAYYTRLVSSNPKIHAIVLNNNLYYSSNDVTEGQEDPGGQLAWLNEQLKLVRTAGEKVGHKIISYEQIEKMAKASFPITDVYSTKYRHFTETFRRTCFTTFRSGKYRNRSKARAGSFLSGTAALRP